MIAWALFYNPMPLEANGWTLWLVLPICASVAIIYKTVRLNTLKRLPQEIIYLIIYMTLGLIVLGGGLWVFHKVIP